MEFPLEHRAAIWQILEGQTAAQAACYADAFGSATASGDIFTNVFGMLAIDMRRSPGSTRTSSQ